MKKAKRAAAPAKRGRRTAVRAAVKRGPAARTAKAKVKSTGTKSKTKTGNKTGPKSKTGLKTKARTGTVAAASKPVAPQRRAGRTAIGTARRPAGKAVKKTARNTIRSAARKTAGASRKAVSKAASRTTRKTVRAAGATAATVVRRARPITATRPAVKKVRPAAAGRTMTAVAPAKRIAGAPSPVAPPRPPRPQRQTARTRASRRKPSRMPARLGATPTLKGVHVHGSQGTAPMAERYAEILTPEALAFVASLHRTFDKTRRELLAARAARQRRFDAGELPDFLTETHAIREDRAWQVAPVPQDLLDRRVEITGPTDRKMVVNALNSGATHYMADFEDANAPTWANLIEGQLNLKDRWAGTIAFTDPASGKHYDIGAWPAVLIVRPRGWHLDERHLTVDGKPVAGALFDFGLYLFHNATAALAAGSGPYFYLPKLESHREARLWNEVFLFAQERLGMPRGTIKVTVLVETLPAAFEMEEILYELRQHIAGMNAGRWDYIFSFIKTFARSADPRFVLPDRGQVVMGKAFLGAYARLLVETCHKRGAFAMGGMAAQIPIKNDPAANAAAFAKVKADKEREVEEGYDGTWVAHPDLVPVATEVFDRLMPQPNQRDRVPPASVGRDDLLQVHEGTRTEAGFRLNIRVGVQYIEAWLGGRGAVPIYHLMEDAATAEISRAQLWQWIKAGVVLDSGKRATREVFLAALDEEMAVVRSEIGAAAYDGGRFPEAIELFRDLTLADDFAPFLTIPAYRLID